ncbi:MAG: hypothetical protein J6Q61_01045 [Bacteroidales bacterium]|nr:hypothetical protein [Bacteroidales bacterium]
MGGNLNDMEYHRYTRNLIISKDELKKGFSSREEFIEMLARIGNCIGGKELEEYFKEIMEVKKT